MWSVCACACAPENHVCVCVCVEDYLCTVRLLGVLVCIYFWVYPGVYCTRALAGRSGKAEPSDGWWQCDRSKWGLFFQAFIVNTAQDYRACKMGVLRKRKHRWTPGRKPGGRGGGEKVWKCSALSNSCESAPHSTETSVLLADARLQQQWLGFSLLGNSLRGGVCTHHKIFPLNTFYGASFLTEWLNLFFRV